MDSFIHILGCGDAFSAGGRNNTCFLIKHNNEYILIDCGATSLPLIRKAGYELDRIRTIVLSHFHGDHFGGIPALILNAIHGDGGREPFTIFSPIQGKERISLLMESMYPGSSSYLDELPVYFHYYDGEPYANGAYSVLGLPVIHAPETIPHGIRIAFEDLIISFSGDTSWSANLIDLASDSDIFIIECNFLDQQSKIHLDYQTILKHLPQLKAKKILLTHMGMEVINQGNIALEKLSDGLKLPL